MNFFRLFFLAAAISGVAISSCERHSFAETKRLYHHGGGHGDGHDEHGDSDHKSGHDDHKEGDHGKHAGDAAKAHDSDHKSEEKAHPKTAPKKGEAKDVGI